MILETLSDNIKFELETNQFHDTFCQFSDNYQYLPTRLISATMALKFSSETELGMEWSEENT